MGMAAPVYYTADMVRALPDDGNRYETVHGELLVTPSPRPWHQVVLERIRGPLWNYLEAHRAGLLLCAPADISWGPDILVQPDLFVVDREEGRTLDWTRMQTLLLAVEVLGPSTARYDRFTKRRLYQEAGVAQYWIVDPEARTVEAWRPADKFPATQDTRLTWHPPGVDVPFTLEIPELFGPL
jgi:Uma2 family endonuclease